MQDEGRWHKSYVVPVNGSLRNIFVAVVSSSLNLHPVASDQN